MGDAGRAVAAARHALRVALDVCAATAWRPGRFRRARMLERVPLPRHRRRHARLRRRQPQRACTRCRRRCTTRRSPPPASTRSTCRCATADFDDFLTFADGDGRRGRQRHDSVQARRAARRRRAADGVTHARWARPTRCARRDGGWEATNTDVDGFLAPLDAAFGGPLERRARRRCSAPAARRAPSWRRCASRGARVTVHARRAEQAREVARRSARGRGAWPPAAGSWDVLVNTHAARRRRPRATSRRCPAGRSTGGWSTT